MPLGPCGTGAPKKARDILTPLYKNLSNRITNQLEPVLAARLSGHATSSASTWIHEVFPQGRAVENGKWHTEMRYRLLQPAPGIDRAPVGATCRHTTKEGAVCGKPLDASCTHEALCGVGGLVIERHDGIRDWLGSKLKEAWGCPVQTEEPVEPPLVTSKGRMDVVATRSGAKTLVDVVVATVATIDPREQARRVKEPGRSLRVAEGRKMTTYGPSALAFAIEDTGRVGPGTSRLLMDLAMSQDLVPAADEYRRLLAELQHLMLSGTAAILQAAVGVVPTQ